MFFAKFLAGVLLIEAYFIYQFASFKQFASDTRIVVQEMNNTVTVGPYMWYALNTQRELYNNHL